MAPDIVMAGTLDRDLVLALRECHSLFIESFNSTDSPSEEQSTLFAQLTKEGGEA
jgi:hypothetical protein